jgi:hypothetical protein
MTDCTKSFRGTFRSEANGSARLFLGQHGISP